MLQPNGPIGEGVGGAELASPAELYAAFIGFIRRQLTVIVLIMLLAVGCGAIYLFTARPMYTGQSVMMIDNRRMQFVQPQAVNDALVDSSTVESQVEVLKSENIALSVIKELRLTDDPEFVHPDGGIIGAVFGFVGSLFESGSPPSEFAQLRTAVRVFESRLTVKRVGLTYVMEINFLSYDPDRAAEIANAIADAYIVDQLDAKYQATRRASTWLQDRIRELRDQSSEAQRAVVEFKNANNIVDAGGRLMNEQQLAELNSQLVQVRSQTSEAKARLDRIQAVLNADSPGMTVDATVADTLKNDVINKLRTQYLDLANREADWSTRYGRNHLAAINLRNQMREIRASIVDELRRIAETYKSDYEIAKQREDGIQKELAQVVSQSHTTNQAQVTLRELESNAQTYRALYDNFLQRYMESVQQQSFPITEARLITKASRPSERSRPRTFLILALSIGGGLVLGLGIGVWRDYSDRVYRTSGQIESSLRCDCIAIVPIVKEKPLKKSPALKPRAKPAAATAAANNPRAIVPNDGILWHVVTSPLSRFSEAIRSIKLAVDVNGAGKSSKVIGITSSVPDEGKSTTACVLAQLIARGGARCILVDCDLRSPSLSRSLAPRAPLGFIDVLAGHNELADVVWTDPTTGLTFLPAGVKSQMSHTSDLLASDASKQFFERLRASYEYVIVDLSPIAPVVDVRATTSFIDSYIFVVEWGRTKTDVVTHALNAAQGVYENLLGVVLNKVDMNVLVRHDGYRGSYYSNYAGRYGYLD